MSDSVTLCATVSPFVLQCHPVSYSCTVSPCLLQQKSTCMPTVKTNLPRAFGQCYVLALVTLCATVSPYVLQCHPYSVTLCPTVSPCVLQSVTLCALQSVLPWSPCVLQSALAFFVVVSVACVIYHCHGVPSLVIVCLYCLPSLS